MSLLWASAAFGVRMCFLHKSFTCLPQSTSVYTRWASHHLLLLLLPGLLTQNRKPVNRINQDKGFKGFKGFCFTKCVQDSCKHRNHLDPCCSPADSACILDIIERLGQGIYQNWESWSSSSIEPHGADKNHSYVDQKQKPPKQEQQ